MENNLFYFLFMDNKSGLNIQNLPYSYHVKDVTQYDENVEHCVHISHFVYAV